MNRVELGARVDGDRLFGVRVDNWPRAASIAQAAEVFGDYWPPRGVKSVEPISNSPEKWFDVDFNSALSLQRFESDFGLYVAESLHDVVAVHAALIKFGDHVVIFPGASHAGKSSFAIAAMKMGYRVLSDEYALISRESGRVSGWPRPIRIRQGDGTVRRIPLEAHRQDYPPTHVVQLQFDAKTPNLHLDTLTMGEVAFSLLANTLCAQSRPEASLRATAAIARIVSGARGVRGDARAALPEFTRWLDETPSRPLPSQAG